MSMTELRLSETARRLKRSVMRDLMAYAVDPEIISLAGGLPAGEGLPVEALRNSIDAVLRRDGARALQYGPPFAPLREWIARYMRRLQVECVPEQVYITNGAQQGLAILSRLLCDPGDAAVIEAVTFTGMQQVTVGRRLAVRTVRTDLSSGVDIEDFERAVARPPTPRAAFLIPNFHNPLGVSIHAAKRRQLVEIAAKYGVALIEDDPYSPLRFSGRPLAALSAISGGEGVFYIGSFSKMLAPAVRLGWIVAPPAVGDRITVLRESLDLESPQLLQRAVFHFLESGAFESHLEQLRAINLRRKQRLLQELAAHLAPLGAQWTDPDGGIFVWVTLPEKVNTWNLFERAVEKKVAFIPGGAFAVEGGYENTLRLNFSNIRDEDIPVAVQRLAAAVEEARQAPH